MTNRSMSFGQNRGYGSVSTAILLLTAALAGCAQPPADDATPGTPPPGSYLLTCSNASLGSDDVLTASCEKLDGSVQATSLANVEGCLAAILNRGDIGNIDGNLVCIPDLPVTSAGIEFPAAETTINGWIYGGDSQTIWNHAWGIWAGLTQVAGEIDGTPARAFETWATPSNMIFRIQSGVGAAAADKPRRRLELMHPRQLTNRAPDTATAAGDGDTSIFVSVAYNPPAADHAIANKLFLQSTLNTYLDNGYTEIPDFPNNAITIKPVFKVITSANSPGGIYTMPGWPGTPVPAKTFPESVWNACVYVDVNGTGAGGDAIDVGCGNRNSANTFFLDNFINNQISAADAAYLTEQLGVTVAAGDYAILVGMHVTSREILRWTWQTFWWSADPSAPEAPSSSAIAAARPLSALDKAAAHYAMAPAYNMVAPAQPVNSGQDVGAAVIGYNPHLEAGFDPGTFQIVRTINAGTPNAITNRYGVETNCMTCHGLAMYDPDVDYGTGGNREKPYAADFYLARNDSVFDGNLQLDFAWSILGSLVLDDNP